jgi:hypothetical protein
MVEGELPEKPGGTRTPPQGKQPEHAQAFTQSASNTLAPLSQELPGGSESERSHDQLVHAFRNLIQQNQRIYSEIRSPKEREVWPPEAMIRKQLDWYSDTPNQEQGEMFFTLRSAWDALAYDRYEIGSKEEGLAGSILQAYYAATHEPTIKLADPRQVRLLDALTEAAGIPHQRGQTEVPIPEKLRNYTKYQMSAEYQTQWAQAQAKRNKEKALSLLHF